MRDNLENFINQHRDEFDDAVPSLDVWAAIDEKLGDQPSKIVTMPKRQRRWRWMAIAASVLLLLGVGIIIGRQTNHHQLAKNDRLMTELEDLRHYYEKEINVKQVKLERYNEGKSIMPDLEEIDANINELIEQIQEIPKGQEEQIIGLMIEHYRTKVAILERVLNSLEQKSNIEENGNKINI